MSLQNFRWRILYAYGRYVPYFGTNVIEGVHINQDFFPSIVILGNFKNSALLNTGHGNCKLYQSYQPTSRNKQVLLEKTEKYNLALNWDLAYLSVRPHLEVFFGTYFNHSISHSLSLALSLCLCLSVSLSLSLSLANTPLPNYWNCCFESPRFMGFGLWRVLSAVRYKSLRWADPSSRGVLPNVCVCVYVRASLSAIKCNSNPLHLQWLGRRSLNKK